MEGLLVLLGLGFVLSPFVAMAMAWSASHRVTDLREEFDRVTQLVRRLERALTAARSVSPPEPVKPAEPIDLAKPAKPAPAERDQTTAESPGGLAPIDLAPPMPTPPPSPPPPPPRSTAPLPLGPTPEQSDRVRHYTDSLRQMHEQAKASGGEPAAVEPAEAKAEAPPIPRPAPRQAPVPPPHVPPTPPIKPRVAAVATKPPISFEELLSTKVIVWIAAVAVALAGVFLVRYFVQRGLLTDPMKITLATLLGVGMIGIGEVARWRKLGMIAQGLVAAGIPILYAAILGAVQLYHMIGVGPAFALLAAVTGAAVALSLRHGQMVALLGLIGGFLMPVLIGAHQKPAVQLFGYLFLLQVALIAVTRHRRWWWLTTFALVAGLVWAGAWIAFWFNPAQQSWVGLFLLMSVAAFIVGCWDVDDDLGGEFRVATLIGWIAVPVALILSAVLVESSGFSNLDWAQLGLMSAASLVLARLRSQYLALPWIGAGIVAMLLAIWGADATSVNTAIEAAAHGVGQLPPRFLFITAAFGVLLAGGAYACIWGSGSPTLFARLSAVAGVGFMLIAYWFVRPDAVAGPWWLWASMAAAVYSGLAMPLHARRADIPGGDGALAAMLVAASTLVAVAVWWLVGEQGMQRPWVTVAWAIQMPAVAYIGKRLRVHDLYAFAGLLGVLIAARLLMNPNIASYPIGDHPLFNWLLWGYGLPVIGFAVTAWVLRDIAGGIGARWCEAAAALVGFAMLTLMVRNGFHPGQRFEGPAELYELATYATAWGIAGLAVALAAERWDRPSLRYASAGLIAAMVAITGVGSLLVLNPVLHPFDLGSTPVLNGMLYVYLLPAALAVAAARVMRRRPAAITLEWCAMAIAFAWLTLEVRHGFFPAWGPGDVGVFEAATYSVVWGLASIALWFAATRGRRQLLDPASHLSLAASILAVIIGPLLLLNPLAITANVGSLAVLNGLLYLYGLPAAIALVSARLVHRRHGDHPAVAALGICGLVLLFALVTLEVRQAFVGPILTGPAPTNAEGYAYSAAWIVFACTLLAAALLIRTPIKTPLRWSSLAVMLAAVAKVFLYDTRQLEDLWRVLSFLGLGASLFVVAWVYQRFVFRRDDAATAEPALEGTTPERAPS